MVLNKQINICLGWDGSPSTYHDLSGKKLRDEILHTFKGMVGYCMKDNGEEHFKFVTISTENMNNGKRST